MFKWCRLDHIDSPRQEKTRKVNKIWVKFAPGRSNWRNYRQGAPKLSKVTEKESARFLTHSLTGTATTLFDKAWKWGGEEIMELDDEADPKAFQFRFPGAYLFFVLVVWLVVQCRRHLNLLTVKDPGYLGVSGPILTLQGVSFAYGDSPPLFSNIDMQLDVTSRIAIFGKHTPDCRSQNGDTTTRVEPIFVTQVRRKWVRKVNIIENHCRSQGTHNWQSGLDLWVEMT